MSVETQIYTALKSLVSNRVYRDIAPPTVTALPRISFQQVGGEAVQFLHADGSATAPLPSKRRARFQVNVWHSKGEKGANIRRDDAMALALQVQDALVLAAGLQARYLGAPVALYEQETDLVGTMQDFSVSFDR